MSGLTGRRPVVQVHPTRRCNLSCAHCYTASGPHERVELPLPLLTDAVDDATRLGYQQLEVSGGEPFLYRGLADLLEAGRQAGMVTSVTTNGMLLTAERLDQVAPWLDVLAISVDGPPAHHDLLRRSPTAFEQMQAHLCQVRANGVPFSFRFTLTRYNIHQLDWLARFASDEGAAMVEVHPLTGIGRASIALRGAEPDPFELLAAVVEIERLRERHPHLALRVETTLQSQLLEHPTAFVGDPDGPLTDLVPVLIVDDLGGVTPLTHDLDPSYRLGSLLDGRLTDLAEAWQGRTARSLAALLTATHADLAGSSDHPACSWYDAVARRSRTSERLTPALR